MQGKFPDNTCKNKWGLCVVLCIKFCYNYNNIASSEYLLGYKEKVEAFQMKNKVVMAAGLLLLAGSLFAYDPPAGGQNHLRLSSPMALTGANSTAGGSVYDVIPSSVLTNPALPAFEQRVVLDLGGTLLTDKNKNEDDGTLGGAFQLGISIPTRWCVPTFIAQGLFAPLVDMPLGNHMAFTANLSKDINDKVSVGLGATFGGFWYKDISDWTFAANTGVYYNYGDLLFMKNLRFGVTLMNLGKMYSKAEMPSIKGNLADDWPGLATPRAGVAANFVDTGDFRIGLSSDFAAPAFQNFVLDLGVALEYSGLSFATFKLASAWEYDVLEFSEGCKNIIPSVGLSVKFNFSAKSDTLAKRGWNESEITVAGAWRNLYKDINAFSAGAVLKLGMEDKDPPVITLWEGEN